ncbi:MAG: potassium channel family protein, partial [Acidimicrobiales bacterium]
MNPFRRLWLASAAVLAVIVAGTVGYMAFGFGFVNAVYQTVTTISTVGFREVEPIEGWGKVFTIFLILGGVGTALYGLGAVVETLIEGHFSNVVWRRRMERQIEAMIDHVVVCGWGRVGRALARYVSGAGTAVVVVDNQAERLQDCPYPYVVGDATNDDILRAAGVERARALVAAINTDAENLYVTLSGRTLCKDLFIVARSRLLGTDAKLLRAGADRVVNPQDIGGARMAAFVIQPKVAEFLDVVMHDGSLEFRLEEVEVPEGSPIAGVALRDAHIRDRAGALVLALRD